jgi:adenylosuccinate synthase
MDPVPVLILLSGAVCAGKTTLADGLKQSQAAHVLTTRTLITAQVHQTAEQLDRGRLQQLGNALDHSTGGRWVADAVRSMTLDRLTVVDAVRTPDQVAAISGIVPTLHVHLTASDSVLKKRYAERIGAQPTLEHPTFAALREDLTEASIEHLASLASLVIDTALHDRQVTLKHVLDLLPN